MKLRFMDSRFRFSLYLFPIVTRLKINNKSAREKSQSYELDREKSTNTKKIFGHCSFTLVSRLLHAKETKIFILGNPNGRKPNKIFSEEIIIPIQ